MAGNNLPLRAGGQREGESGPWTGTAEVVRLYDTGLSLRQVARQLGVSTKYVYTRLIRAGHERRPARTPEKQVDVTEIVRLYDSGLSIADVADRLGVSTGLVRDRLRTAGQVTRPGGAHRREFDTVAARQLYESGLTLKQVAAMLGVADATVRARFRETGVPVRPHGEHLGRIGRARRLDVDVTEVVRLYDSGLPMAEIADRLGVSGQTIRARLAEMGHPIRPAGPAIRAATQSPPHTEAA